MVSVLLDPAQLRFFGDGGMWASVAISQLYMEGESILLVFRFVLNHGKNLTEKPIKSHKSDSVDANENFFSPLTLITSLFLSDLSVTGTSIISLITKITVSSLVIGLKKSYFPLICLPSCYRTVCYWIVCYWTVCYQTVQKANHIQRCSLNQPITFKVLITCACARANCFCVFAGYLRMFTPPLMRIFLFFHNLAVFLFLGNCNFYD